MPHSTTPGLARIVNGTEAAPHSIPWQAEIGWTTTNSHKWVHYCAGAILSKRYVLTAGHCTRLTFCPVYCEETFCKNYPDCNMQTCCIPSKNYCFPLCASGQVGTVVVKEHNITDSSDGQEHIGICNWQKHPAFNSTNLNGNDVALIYLKQSIVMDARAIPACLPTSLKMQEDNFLVGKTLTVSGWGTDKIHIFGTDVLMRINVIGESNEKCKKILNYPDVLSPYDICGIPLSHQTPCSGDSGGPLTYMDENGINSVVGILSHGEQDINNHETHDPIQVNSSTAT